MDLDDGFVSFEEFTKFADSADWQDVLRFNSIKRYTKERLVDKKQKDAERTDAITTSPGSSNKANDIVEEAETEVEAEAEDVIPAARKRADTGVGIFGVSDEFNISLLCLSTTLG